MNRETFWTLVGVMTLLGAMAIDNIDSIDSKIKDLDLYSDIPLQQAQGNIEASKIRVCIKQLAKKSTVIHLEECLP